ncbi:MAG: AsmA family protein, partial [Phycisphaerales bacterium]|nr:AsmA family protein [Phycisphaerales bacterium]
MLLVLTGVVVRCWAWVEMAIRFWLFQFIMTASGDLLGPQLHFANLQYQFPFTVVLQAPELTSEDESFLMARRMRLTLERLPISGEPIQFSKIVFVRPVVRVIWKEDGSLVGLNGEFIRSIDGEQYTKAFSTAPSDFLRIERIDIEQGSLRFEPFSEPPILINDITTWLDAQPNSSTPGEYRIDLAVDRSPALVSDMEAVLDIDQGHLTIQSFNAEMIVDPDDADDLPDDLKRIFDEYQVAGDMRLRAEGTIPFGAFNDMNVIMEVQLEDGSASFDGFQIPVPRLEGDMNIHGGVIDLESMIVTLEYGGHVSLSGHLGFDEGMPFDLFVDMDRVQLGGVLRRVRPDLPNYTGLMSLQGSVESQVDDVIGHLSGHGVFSLSQG